MKVLIFGGSFNPPTLAHEAIIAECLKLPGFDQVWVMPSGNRSDKHIGTPAKDRLAMLVIVKNKHFANNPRLIISDFELNLPEPTATFTTVKELTAAYPSTQFWFVIGGDSYRSMSVWPHGEELKKNLRIIVVSDKTTQHQTLHLSKELSVMSSTQARSSADALHAQVSPAVAEYALAHKLYS